MVSNRLKFLIMLLVSLLAMILLCCDNSPKPQTPINCLKEESSQEQKITKIIHQSWKNRSIPHRFKLYNKSWTESCFKDWRFIFWTDEDNHNLIQNHYPWFLKKYLELPSIHRADVSRYFYMFHYGGIYTDLDNECLRPFDFLLSNFSLVFGAMKGQYLGTSLKEGYVQNSFMYSRPRHQLWLKIIMTILHSRLRSAPETQTGPVLLSNTLLSYQQKCPRENLKIYPPIYFNPFSWLYKNDSSNHCKDYNKMSDEDWHICKSSFVSKGSYVVQYHAHTWKY